MTLEDRVLNHYEKPYHRHIPTKPSDFYSLLIGRAENETCGDWIRCWVRISSNEMERIVGIWWEGKGCCFSQAAASMIAEHLEAKRLEDARMFTQDEMLNLFRLDIDPNRIECVMVAYNAVQNALEKM